MSYGCIILSRVGEGDVPLKSRGPMFLLEVCIVLLISFGRGQWIVKLCPEVPCSTVETERFPTEEMNVLLTLSCTVFGN